MKFNLFTLLCISFLLFSLGFKGENNGKSKVLHFNQIGWGDTIYAFIGGVIISEEKGVQTPLVNVKVKLISSTSIVTDSALTDSTGNYVLKGFKGIYRINFNKPSFQTLTVENYESWPDMSSTLNIELEKGVENQFYFLPDSMQFKGRFKQ